MNDIEPVDLTETASWNHTEIAWTSLGDGPPIVMCHGTPWSSHTWRHAARALSSTHQVHLWDMPGFGRSVSDDVDVSIAAQAEVLAVLIDQVWQLDDPVLIAHDIGGAVALRTHLLHDVDIAALALVDVVALAPWGSPFFRLVRDHADVFEALPPNLHAALVREYISTTGSQLPPALIDVLAAPWLDSGQRAFYRQIAAADPRHTEELADLFATIDVPTLVAWGEADAWIPVEQAHRLHRAINGSRVVTLPGAGHLVQEDDPAGLTDLLADWLGELEQ